MKMRRGIGMKLSSLLIGTGKYLWSSTRKKTKEIVFNFRRNQKEIEPVVINGVEIDIVTELKYLGTYIDNQLTGILTHTNIALRQTSGSTFWGNFEII